MLGVEIEGVALEGLAAVCVVVPVVSLAGAVGRGGGAVTLTEVFDCGRGGALLTTARSGTLLYVLCALCALCVLCVLSN